MTTEQVRQGLVWVLRIGFYALFAALLLRQCQGEDAAAAGATPAVDPVALQAECFDNVPPLYYDQAGTCYSADPTGLNAEERALVVVVPTARGGPAAPGTEGGPSATQPGPLPPGLVDPRSPLADPPPALAPPGGSATGSGGTGTTGTTSGGEAPPADGADPDSAPAAGGTGSQPDATGGGPVGGTAQTPTSPSLGYIAEDGRTDTVTKGPELNGIQVWVHAESRTLYADSCEVLQTITQQGQEFGPTQQAPGYGSICPQL